MAFLRSLAILLSCARLAVAALAPLITPGPVPHLEHLEQRQVVDNTALSAVIWTPSGYGTRSYSQYTITGYTIGQQLIGEGAAYWEYCLFSATTCQFYTACTSGVRVGQNNARSTCEHPVYPSCGTQLLVMNTGTSPYSTATHPWCFPLGAASSILYYVNSPTEQAVINTGAIITGSGGSGAVSDAETLTGGAGPTTVFVTAPPNDSSGRTPAPSSTPVGAIVGGAVGGVAVLAIVAGIVVLILHRRKQKENAALLQRTSAPVPAYDPKHVAQNMAYFPPPGSVPHYGPHELQVGGAPQAYQNSQAPTQYYEATPPPVELQSASPRPYKP